MFSDQYETMTKNEIRAAVYTKEMAEGMSDEAVCQGKNAYFHIKIDTGMGRIGFPVNSESVNLIERSVNFRIYIWKGYLLILPKQMKKKNHIR